MYSIYVASSLVEDGIGIIACVSITVLSSSLFSLFSLLRAFSSSPCSSLHSRFLKRRPQGALSSRFPLSVSQNFPSLFSLDDIPSRSRYLSNTTYIRWTSSRWHSGVILNLDLCVI